MRKMFLYFRLLIIIGFASTIFNSCKDADNIVPDEDVPNDDIPSSTLSSVDIKDAESLFISSSNEGNTLYGVKSTSVSPPDSEGQIFEIKYLNDEGEEIQKTNPAYIYNLKDFMVLTFGDQYSFDEAYLVKKSDGKVFEIPYEYIPHIVGNKYDYLGQYLNTEDKIQEDGNNNMYYMTYQTSTPHKRTLYKISLSTTSSLQFQEVSAVNDDVSGFCVDKNGNIHYGFYDSNTQGYKYRYRKSDGSFSTPAFPEGMYNNRIWIGTDGYMYGAEWNVGSGIDNYSDLGKIQDGIFSKTIRLNVDLNDSRFGETFNVKGKIFYTYYDYNPNKFFNISNETEFAEITCPIEVNSVLNDNLFHFDKSTLVLTLIDAVNGSTAVYYDLDETKVNNYDIDKIINIAQDGITFSAVDLNNGQYVVAKIFIDNTVTIQKSISGLVTTVMSLN